MLSKLKGVFAPRPRAGPHKLRECIPLVVLLRNRLKYALNNRESQFILRQRNVKIDGRIRVDPKYPVGFMDVLQIPKTKDIFRILLDSKGRFNLVRISEEESGVKLCKVTKRLTQANRVPAIVTHDGRTIRYPDPNIAVGDTVVLDTVNRKIKDFTKFKVGTLAMINGGKNMGRIGVVSDIERHPGSFDIVHIRDKADNTFATRATNVFVIGRDADAPLVTLPKGDGVRTNVLYEREVRLEKAAKAARRHR
jgi:small subunit ribosomal protein S4e